MIELSKKILTVNWLQNKLINQENGIILGDADFSCFDIIQNFIEANDHPFQTPVIYYEAFPEESAAELIATLREEITAKLGTPKLYRNKSLSEIVVAGELKMVIIDRSHLYSLKTVEDFLEQFEPCGVCLLLVGSYSQMKMSQLLDHPNISQWSRFIVNQKCELVSEIY